MHIIGSMDPITGGPCQGIRNSNPAMRRLGVYREVVSLDDPASAFLGSDDFPIHALGPAKGMWQYSSKLLPWLVANVHRFDVIVINGLWIFSSYAGWKAVRMAKKNSKVRQGKIPQLFVMPHGMLDPYFQRAPERRIKPIRNWLYWNLIEKRLLNDADGLLFTSETELLLARETFKGYNPYKEFNVGYGIIPPPAYSKQMKAAFVQKCPLLNDQPYLLFISRVHNKKGVDLLIESYIKLLDKVANLPKLVIAGPGLDSVFGKKIYKRATSSPLLRQSILFTGMITGDAKWGAIYGCEAFILPSHQENFGIAVVEALSCSKPVLISDQVNIWREIESGGGGIIAKDTLQGTIELLQKWCNLTLEEKNDIGCSALNVYHRHFDIEHSSNKFYNAIAGNRGGA